MSFKRLNMWWFSHLSRSSEVWSPEMGQALMGRARRIWSVVSLYNSTVMARNTNCNSEISPFMEWQPHLISHCLTICNVKGLELSSHIHDQVFQMFANIAQDGNTPNAHRIFDIKSCAAHASGQSPVHVMCSMYGVKTVYLFPAYLSL